MKINKKALRISIISLLFGILIIVYIGISPKTVNRDIENITIINFSKLEVSNTDIKFEYDNDPKQFEVSSVNILPNDLTTHIKKINLGITDVIVKNQYVGGQNVNIDGSIYHFELKKNLSDAYLLLIYNLNQNENSYPKSFAVVNKTVHPFSIENITFLDGSSYHDIRETPPVSTKKSYKIKLSLDGTQAKTVSKFNITIDGVNKNKKPFDDVDVDIIFGDVLYLNSNPAGLYAIGVELSNSK